VVAPREGEADAGVVEAALERLGRGVELHADLLEHVGAAGLARGRAVPVLDDLDAARGGDEGRGGRDVERPADVAAGAAGIEDDLGVRVAPDGHRLLPHHPGRPG
jgi:hypothetical protein